MIDLFQLFLIIIIGSLTAVMVYIGFQIAAILKEVKKTLAKMNQVIDKSEQTLANISQSCSRGASFFEGLTSIFQLINFFRGRSRNTEDK